MELLAELVLHREGFIPLVIITEGRIDGSLDHVRPGQHERQHRRPVVGEGPLALERRDLVAKELHAGDPAHAGNVTEPSHAGCRDHEVAHRPVRSEQERTEHLPHLGSGEQHPVQIQTTIGTVDHSGDVHHHGLPVERLAFP